MNPATASRVSPWRAAIPMLFNRKKFMDLAVVHALALCAANKQYTEVIAQGEFPPAGWRDKTKSQLAEPTAELVHSFWSSLGVTLLFVAVGLIAAWFIGRLALDRPIGIGKILSVLGAFLAAWATLFELGGVAATFSGEQLHELVHPILFRAVFLPGVSLATAGQVW